MLAYKVFSTSALSANNRYTHIIFYYKIIPNKRKRKKFLMKITQRALTFTAFLVCVS